MTDDQIKEKIFRRVEDHFDEQLEFLTQLIRIKSLVGQEEKGQRFFAQACRDSGLQVETFETDKEIIEKHPAYIAIDKDTN